MTQSETIALVLQDRRQQLLESICQAANGIRQIDDELQALELEAKA